MSYTPTEWESTDVVTATRMNALEQAVGDMNMSYTPNTWSDGDILSAEKMNALEQAVASGGGGSSDFSTAEVTITGISEGAFVPIVGCCCFNDYNVLLTFAEIGAGVYTVPLYKGAVVFFPDPDLVYTLSGNATVDEDIVRITGDCTITIS